jgi:hypothetical protein
MVGVDMKALAVAHRAARQASHLGHIRGVGEEYAVAVSTTVETHRWTAVELT